jgi:hypothetical protein
MATEMESFKLTLSLIKLLPSDVSQLIFEMDSTYKMLFSTQVLNGDQFNNVCWSKEARLDREATVRNFFEGGWAITPRYVLLANGEWITRGRFIKRR